MKSDEFVINVSRDKEICKILNQANSLSELQSTTIQVAYQNYRNIRILELSSVDSFKELFIKNKVSVPDLLHFKLLNKENEYKGFYDQEKFPNNRWIGAKRYILYQKGNNERKIAFEAAINKFSVDLMLHLLQNKIINQEKFNNFINELADTEEKTGIMIARHCLESLKSEEIVKWIEILKFLDDDRKKYVLRWQSSKEFVYKGINQQLIQKYGIKCCPYCNENFIVNRKKKNGKKYTMAQLDHFFPRDKYPIFSVSLYNLVPSCSSCNHIKSIEEIGISPHDHSYNFSHLRISYIPQKSNWLDDPREIKVSFKYDVEDIEFKEKMERNLEVMAIQSSYNSHVDYIQEILKKAQIYSKEMRNDLLNSFPELFSSDDEIIRIIFGNYIDATDFLKRPFSKLTRDLLEEVGIIDL